MRDARHRAPVLYGSEYRCRWHGPARNPALIDYIVIHDTESGPNTAKAVARWGASSGAIGRASWHFTVDDTVLIRCLPDDITSYTAPPLNSDGLHIEIVGRAAWSKREWYRHQATLKRAAWQVARWSIKYQIPVKLLSNQELSRGSTGIVTHAQVSRVFRKSDHTDPGQNFPMTYFLWLVRRRVKWLKDG